MTFADFVHEIISATSLLVIPTFIAITTMLFIWGIARYFIMGSDSTKRQEAHAFALWGILGMVLLFSVWGLVRLLLVTLGIS